MFVWYETRKVSADFYTFLLCVLHVNMTFWRHELTSYMTNNYF